MATNKYNSVVGYLGLPLPTWVTSPDDAARVAAYDGYDDMYKNAPGTFAIREGDEPPVLVPGARRIIEATNRYLGKDWEYTVTSVNPDAQVGGADQMNVQMAFHALFTREEFRSKMFSLKRNMLKRGDALLHITANFNAAAGARLSINEIHPRNFFRIPDPNNEEVLQGCYITDLIFADDGKTQIARRQEYRYQPDGSILTKLTFWEPNSWDDRYVGHPALKTASVPLAVKQDPAMASLLTGFTLPPSVKMLPVYLFRNGREGGEPFGTSQVAGIETLIGAISQNVSDEDITLAIQGLGVYVTDSESPIDSTGAETDWMISPGVVLQTKTGSKFDRVGGVSSVVPFGDHIKVLQGAIDQSAGLSATAVGMVDASVAASGVALRLDMAPILAQNEEKEEELRGRLDQMFFDLLTMWFPVDGFPTPAGVMVVNSFGDPLPVDRSGAIAEVISLVTAGLASKEWAINYLSETLGFQFPVGMMDAITQEAAGADPVGARILTEAAAGASGGTPNPGSAGNPAPVV